MIILKLMHLDQVIIANHDLLNVKSPGAIYFTLHSSPASTPLYKSSEEKICSGARNVKWSDINIAQLLDERCKLLPGVIIRVWQTEDTSQTLLFSWGVYFSALKHIGDSYKNNKYFAKNTVVFGLNNKFYTAYESCCLEEVRISASRARVGSTYSKDSVLRLRSLQRSIVKQTAANEQLRSTIENWDLRPPKRDELIYRTGRHFLGLVETNPGNHIEERKTRKTLLAKKETIELRLGILRNQKSKKEEDVEKLLQSSVDVKISLEKLRNSNLKKRTSLEQEDLTIENLSIRCKKLNEELANERNRLGIRKRRLISDLCQVYPITKDDQYTYIHSLPLSHAESLTGLDEVKLSVAIGYVAHLVYMTSYFLNIPLRHPIICKGSMSSIVDQLREGVAKENDRIFPLFVKGRNRSLFNYGVYLLNRNIGQLRHYLGLKTGDLGAILPNLDEALRLRYSTLGNWDGEGSGGAGSQNSDLVLQSPGKTARTTSGESALVRTTGQHELFKFLRFKFTSVFDVNVWRSIFSR